MCTISYTTFLLLHANTEGKVVQGFIPLVSCSFALKFQVDSTTTFKIDRKTQRFVSGGQIFAPVRWTSYHTRHLRRAISGKEEEDSIVK